MRTLAAQIFDAVGVMSSSIRLELAIEDLHLAIDSAIPCGLVLNELITNAVKHAFPGAKWNVIKAEFDGQVVITAALSIPAGDWYTQLEGLKWDSSQ